MNIVIGVLLFAVLCMSNVSHAQEPLTLAIQPYRPAVELIEMWTPFADYVGRKIHSPVKIKIFKDYDEHIHQAGADKADIAFIGPMPYIKMADIYGKKNIIARLEIGGKTSYTGKIIVAKDSPIKKLSDLKGKRFAFGDRNSTMSSILPRYMLYKAGVLDKLSGAEFIKNHENVALGVLTGSFDAGAVRSEIFYKYEKRGLRAIATTPSVSTNLFIAGGKVPSGTLEALRGIFLRMNDDEQGRYAMSAIGVDITGMKPAAHEDYAGLHLIVRTLKSIGAAP